MIFLIFGRDWSMFTFCQLRFNSLALKSVRIWLIVLILNAFFLKVLLVLNYFSWTIHLEAWRNWRVFFSWDFRSWKSSGLFKLRDCRLLETLLDLWMEPWLLFLTNLTTTRTHAKNFLLCRLGRSWSIVNFLVCS